MHSTWKIKLLGTLIVVLILVIIFRQYDPTLFNFYPKCIIKSVTRYQCPGCGIQRATYHLLNFNFKKAFILNPLFVSLLPYMVLVYFTTVIFKGNAISNKLNIFLLNKFLIGLLFIIVVSFTIYRNL